ncbi:hypothetical protein SSDC_01170 [Candidatus Profftella armatura]|uniref:Uncharacterized protein n=1 Tax=Candidatus Profftella armatura TaxID=669502 RepID=S5RPX2_9PROT|nr:hypothetical protein SSDC_01170 [Candidatus Profftella armatura]
MNTHYKNNFYQLNENLKLNSIQMINLLIYKFSYINYFITS